VRPHAAGETGHHCLALCTRAVAAENLIVTRDQPKDAAQTALITRYRTALGPIAGEVVGSTSVVLTRVQERLFPTGTTFALGCELSNCLAASDHAIWHCQLVPTTSI
jgi:hypothetical protein